MKQNISVRIKLIKKFNYGNITKYIYIYGGPILF